MIKFGKPHEELPCPVCGYPAEIQATQPALDWEEIRCENCLAYTIKADAEEGITDC
jgi:hypothetical protein